jgi:hypothetical protein
MKKKLNFSLNKSDSILTIINVKNQNIWNYIQSSKCSFYNIY